MKKGKISNITNFFLTKCLFISSLILILFSAPVTAEGADPYTAAELRQAMVIIMESIENAAGLEPHASKLISELSDEEVETIYGPIENKEQIIEAAQQIIDRIELAEEAGLSEGLAPTTLSLAVTTAFPPNYPSGVDYAFLLLLGLIDSPDDRCDGQGYENYKAVLVGAEKALLIGDAACTVAGCDPTGIACASVCISVEATKLGFLTARLPIDACDAQGGDVDSAEIEAAYENGVSSLANDASIDGDLTTHDTQMKQQLTTHDTQMKQQLTTHDTQMKQQLTTHDTQMKQQLSTHDSDIKQQISDHDAAMNQRFSDLEAAMNQRFGQVDAQLQEIIKLLKTPQGKRPGWNEQDW